MPFLLQIRGENVLYFNVKDKGIVTVTGCGHPGIINLLNFARDTFKANRLYGCYGGLHLSIFDTWKPEFDDIIEDVKALRHGEDGLRERKGQCGFAVPALLPNDGYGSHPQFLYFLYSYIPIFRQSSIFIEIFSAMRQ
jgi:hypothetical protein